MYEPKNEVLKNYLSYTEGNESPRIFHLWSIITGISACLGRRSYLPFGIGPVYPNLYTILVGPPGTRKNTAINIITRKLRKHTGMRFAPEDTAGQRQGLIMAMKGKSLDKDEEMEAMLAAATAAADLDVLGSIETKIDARDEHVMFVAATELDSFMGTKSREFATFLGKMWDGDDYDYTLKAEKHTLENPLLTLLAGTTPGNIQDTMPQASIGQGFMSRVVFVYANRSRQKIAWPQEVGKNKALEKLVHDLYYYFDGEFHPSAEAKEMLTEIYHQDVEVHDPRFIYYCDRRHQHLLKLCMVLAATRKDLIIRTHDVEEAHFILQNTEKYMPDALGEFGLSQTSAAKQKLLEFLIHANGPVTVQLIWALMQKDLRLVDFHNTLADLVNANKIIQVKTNEGPAYVYNARQSNAFESVGDDLLQELAE